MTRTIDHSNTNAIVSQWIRRYVSVIYFLFPNDLARWPYLVAVVQLVLLSLFSTVEVLQAEFAYVYVASERVRRPVRSSDFPRAEVHQSLLVAALEHFLVPEEYFLVNQL